MLVCMLVLYTLIFWIQQHTVAYRPGYTAYSEKELYHKPSPPRSLSDQYTEHTAAYISIQQHTTEYTKVYRVYRVYKTAYGIQDSIQHTRQHTTHHTNIPQHTCSLYVRGCSVFSIKTTVCFIWFCVWVLTKIHILTDTTDPY